MAKDGIFSIFMAKLKIVNKLIGRKKELDQLTKLKDSGSPAFLAVYGRRRVGKTFLIRQAFDNQFDFYLTGISNGSLALQLANFHAALIQFDPLANEKGPAADWFTAFQQLTV